MRGKDLSNISEQVEHIKKTYPGATVNLLSRDKKFRVIYKNSFYDGPTLSSIIEHMAEMVEPQDNSE